MRDILVPVDFSPNANKALDFAVRIARQSGSKLFIIHASYLPDVHTRHGKDFLSHLGQAEENLKMIRESIETTEQVIVETKVYQEPLINSIIQAAATHDAGMIVMGTLGESGVEEKIFGSKTAMVIDKSNIPVLAVPLLCEWKIPKKILFADHRFHSAREELKPLIDFARLFNAELHLAIFSDTDKNGRQEYLSHEKELHRYESNFKKEYKDVLLKTVHLEGHKFIHTIEEYITQNEIDIVSMVAYKQQPVSALFQRSLAKKMSYHTNIPLLTLPV